MGTELRGLSAPLPEGRGLQGTSGLTQCPGLGALAPHIAGCWGMLGKACAQHLGSPFPVSEEGLGKLSPSLLQKVVMRAPGWRASAFIWREFVETQRDVLIRSREFRTRSARDYFIINQTIICGWDYSHFRDEETEAQSDTDVCQSW